MELVLNRKRLYENVWRLEALGDNAVVAIHIKKLRGKLEKASTNPRYIETVWGTGYPFRG